VLVALYLGMRASEVVNICRRDVDARGQLLWIPDSKTENGRRTLEVADVLRPMLWERSQACGDDPDARLFAHDRGWGLYNVKRLCRAAKVPEVTAHGARGIHATIATQMGTTSHMVALALGHGSAEVTRRHYIRPGAAEQATQAQLEQLIEALKAQSPALRQKASYGRLLDDTGDRGKQFSH
jgi:integrase